MPDLTFPDVYLTETLNQDLGSAGPAIPSGAMLGKAWRGSQTPTLVRNWTQFDRTFGGFYPSSSYGSSYLPYAVYYHFANGGGDLWVGRVLHSDAVSASKALYDQANVPSEVQTITVDATGGDYTITWSGQTTAPIAYNALAAAVQAALEALSNVAPGDVTVTGGVGASGGGTPYTLTWESGSGNVAAPTTTVNGSGDGDGLTGGAATAVVATPTGGNNALPTLEVTAIDKGVWGNDIHVQTVARGADRFDLIVYYGGTTASYQVERWNDLAMSQDDVRYVESVVNSVTRGSEYIRVANLDSVTASPLNIPAIGTEQLASGDDGGDVVTADYTTALSGFDSVSSPLVLNVPGESSSTLINAALAYAAGRTDVFVVVDPASGGDAEDASSYVDTLTETSYGAVYYPWVVVNDPAAGRPGVQKVLPPGGFVLGQFMKTDRERGPQKAPAGVPSRLIGAVDLETALTEDNLATLHASHVNAIRPYHNAGICIMGARTIKRSGSDRYIPVRRTIIYLAEQLTSLTRFAVFEPNHAELWELVVLRCTKFLADFHSAGGLKGGTASEAFFVKCDSENNTPQTIEQGIVNVQIGVSLLYPAEFIVINLAQWEGGTNVNTEETR